MRKGKHTFKVVMALPDRHEVMIDADAFDEGGDHLEFLILDGNEQECCAMFHEGSWLYFVRVA